MRCRIRDFYFHNTPYVPFEEAYICDISLFPKDIVTCLES